MVMIDVKYQLDNIITNLKIKLCIKAKIRICKTIILPVDLYGCEMWSLTLRKEPWVKVFENGGEENIWTAEG
jgi:hypothetical protein